MNQAIPHAPSLVSIAAAITLLWAGATQAQIFTVDQLVLSGGGGTSTNGPFSLTGSIGQPTAGPQLAGVPFTFDSGFWSTIEVLPTSASPLVTIIKSGSDVAILWPVSDATFILEVTPSLAPPIVWLPAGETPVIIGQDNHVAIPTSLGSSFYRLRRTSP